MPSPTANSVHVPGIMTDSEQERPTSSLPEAVAQISKLASAYLPSASLSGTMHPGSLEAPDQEHLHPPAPATQGTDTFTDSSKQMRPSDSYTRRQTMINLYRRLLTDMEEEGIDVDSLPTEPKEEPAITKGDANSHRVYLSKPYPHEHAARQADPKSFDSLRRQNNKFGPGIDVIWGIKDGKTQVQSIRFDAKRFSAEQARKWLAGHNYKTAVEGATGVEKTTTTPVEKVYTALCSICGQPATDAEQMNVSGQIIPVCADCRQLMMGYQIAGQPLQRTTDASLAANSILPDALVTSTSALPPHLALLYKILDYPSDPLPCHPTNQGGDVRTQTASTLLKGGADTRPQDELPGVDPKTPTDQMTDVLKDAASDADAGSTKGTAMVGKGREEMTAADAKEWSVEIVKGDDSQHLIYAVVYKPGFREDGTVIKENKDSQGDLMKAAEIEAMCHDWLLKSRLYDLQHRTTVDARKAAPVESYIAPLDFDLAIPSGTKHIIKGSWVLVTKILDDDLWQDVKENVGGYSIRGFGKRKKVNPAYR